MATAPKPKALRRFLLVEVTLTTAKPATMAAALVDAHEYLQQHLHAAISQALDDQLPNVPWSDLQVTLREVLP